MNDELNLYVYDRSFTMIGVVERYTSLIWSDRFDEPGDFELTVIYDQELRNLLVQDRYVTTDYTDRYAIIEKIEISKDEDGNAEMIITGRTLECMLERRIILNKLEFGKNNTPENLQNSIRTILNNNLITPEDANRIFPNFVFLENHSERVSSLTIVDESFDKTNVFDAISGLCEEKHLGFKIEINSSHQYVFSLYKGTDRSADVLFSPYYDNLNNSEYFSDFEKYKNFAYIPKNENSYLEATNSSIVPSGYNRIETSFDETELKDNSKDELSDEELIRKAVQKLNLECKKETGIDGEIIPDVFYTYRTDYFVGDKVMIENEYGDSEPVYISEIVITYDENGLSIIPTFKMIDWEWS